VRVRNAIVLSIGVALAAQSSVKLERAQPIPVIETLPDDEAVAKVIAPLSLEMKATFGKELVTAPKGLFRARGGEESTLGYWVSDLMRERAEQIIGAPVKFAITNSGGLRGNIRPGVVKVSDIFEVMPFENEMVVAEYTGAEIVQIVKDGIYRRQGEPCSGVKAKVSGTPEKPEFSITWADGSAIDPEEMVKVALTDYLLASGDGVSTLRKGRRAVTTGIVLRDLLLDACTKLGERKAQLLPPAGQRFVIPPEMYQAFRDKKVSR